MPRRGNAEIWSGNSLKTRFCRTENGSEDHFEFVPQSYLMEQKIAFRRGLRHKKQIYDEVTSRTALFERLHIQAPGFLTCPMLLEIVSTNWQFASLGSPGSSQPTRDGYDPLLQKERVANTSGERDPRFSRERLRRASRGSLGAPPSPFVREQGRVGSLSGKQQELEATCAA